MTDLYYFTGTGNSLAVAKKIYENIENSTLTSIPKVVNSSSGISGDVIGIICPIYMYNMPHIVARFIRKIEKANYIFFVYAGEGGLGSGITATNKLFDEVGLTLSALFNVRMPGNYTPYGITPIDKQNKLFADIDRRAEEISHCVKERGEFIDSNNTHFLMTHIFPGVLYRWAYGHIKKMDKSFFTDDNCTGCGVCVDVCPVRNVSLEDNTPVWHHKCELCYACVQWCPEKSIQVNKKSHKIERYHHPDISVAEIIEGRS